MPTKRFGARYGRKPREQFAIIEKLQRAKHVCPSCQKKAVKRLAVGIWQCQKCEHKFAGKAYTP
ncbi:MAG TPA: 50S ribosomal protein L37ae [Candidatus Nanoarchaeia archaeon]|nr:50S ribosomal protein L37ae [Candidatus Nanoarchaeia archaeon]